MLGEEVWRGKNMYFAGGGPLRWDGARMVFRVAVGRLVYGFEVDEAFVVDVVGGWAVAASGLDEAGGEREAV